MLDKPSHNLDALVTAPCILPEHRNAARETCPAFDTSEGRIDERNKIAMGSHEQPRRPINRVASAPPPSLASATSFAERLIALRLNLGMTQAQVADRTVVQFKSNPEPHSLSRTAYCMYERGGAQPDFETTASLASTFGVSPGWLAFGEGSPWPKAA